ncbi:MAG: hypothetical protein Q7S40_08775 [Opitutaceae bacterium]|nr:hypothetical protein [Opitutaceae bacterium]
METRRRPENTGTRTFLAPNPGGGLDWVLVLDDATKGFPPPGVVPRPRRWSRSFSEP